MEATATTPTRDAAAPLWRRLITATTLGWVLGIVAGVLLIVLAESLGLRSLQSPLLVGVALGLGWQQHRALRDLLPGARTRWLGATCIGLAAPFLVADVASTIGRPLPYDLVPFTIAGGLLASMLQWRVLTSFVRSAAGWLLASPLAFIAAATVVWLNDRVLPKVPGVPGLLLYVGVTLFAGVLFGCITAAAAVRFVPRSGAAADA